MTCGDGNFEYLTRPYPYKRSPFQLATGELVAYEGVYFSRPASGLMFEKRLFTGASSHPVASTVKLYVNKDAGLSSTIEPDDDGTIYQSATPHYADYILDLRSLISDVTALHAADSDHVAQQFLTDHLSRARSTYDLSAHDISENDYVHPTPVNVVPSGATPPGSSGSIPAPGDGFELGAKQITDIDVDEVQWQPIARPKKLKNSTPASIPTEPIFPAVLRDGGFPTLSTLDVTNLEDLALHGEPSGGLVLTGDLLLAGTSLKLSVASGVSPTATASFIQDVPWKLFPSNKEMCTYYAPHEDANNIISARGRQGIYEEMSLVPNGVYLLAISDSGDTSGSVVQHYPANYQAISGIDDNGHAHNGVHVVDKLIYNITSQAADGTMVGYSPINGKKVFAHWVGQEVGSKGESFLGAYNNGDNVFAKGNITNFNIGAGRSRQNWATTNATLSPVSWANLITSNLGARFSPWSGNGVTFVVRDIQAGSERGVISRQKYANWGFIDRVISPDKDRSQGGQLQTKTIESLTTTYREGTDENGEFQWIEIESHTRSQAVTFNQNTFTVRNIFSFFFDKKTNNGMVHANGDVFFQWGNKLGSEDELPRNNLFAPFGEGTFRTIPEKSRSVAIYSIGFFPAWKRQLSITNSTQARVPHILNVSPGASKRITFDSDLNFDDSLVESFSPPVWDPDEGINYIYFRMIISGSSRIFFAHMSTDFCIFRFNQTGGDGFLTGKAALLSI